MSTNTNTVNWPPKDAGGDLVSTLSPTAITEVMPSTLTLRIFVPTRVIARSPVLAHLLRGLVDAIGAEAKSMCRPIEGEADVTLIDSPAEGMTGIEATVKLAGGLAVTAKTDLVKNYDLPTTVPQLTPEADRAMFPKEYGAGEYGAAMSTTEERGAARAMIEEAWAKDGPVDDEPEPEVAIPVDVAHFGDELDVANEGHDVKLNDYVDE